MRALIAGLLMAVVLAGCTTFGARWDNNEYAALANMKTDVVLIQKKCALPDAVKWDLDELKRKTTYFIVYAEHLPRNSDTYDIAKQLESMVDEMIVRYNKPNPPSKAYCLVKTKNIIKGLDIVMKGVVKKVRD